MFFRQILMGQVLTRMQMTWCGVPATTREAYKRTFPILVTLTIAYYVVFMFFHCDEDYDIEDYDFKDYDIHTSTKHHDQPACHGWRHSVLGIVQFAWFLYTVVVMIRLRKAVRDRYKIPQRHCPGCEDCCCVVCCSCCTISQLARQTADYQRHRAYCCTENGLAEEQYTLEEALVV